MLHPTATHLQRDLYKKALLQIRGPLFVTMFCVENTKFFVADPGSCAKIRDNIPDPQH